MERIISKHKNKILIFILIIVSLFTHFEWFSFTNIIAFGDWVYRYPERLIEIPLNWTSWLGFVDLGAPNIMVYSYFYRFTTSIIPIIGLNIESVNIIVLIPLAILSFLSPYYYLKDKGPFFYILIFSLYWGSFLPLLDRSTTHIPIAIGFTLFPILVKKINDFYINISIKNTIFIFFILQVILSYDIRVFLVAFIVYLVYFLLNINYFKKIIFHLFFIFISILISNVYIFITVLTSKSAFTESVSSSVFAPYLFNIVNSFIIQPYSWYGLGFDTFFNLQPPKLYLFIQPIILIYFLYLYNKLKFKLTVIENMNFKAGLLLLILGIFLTKGSSIPFVYAYEFLFSYIPGMSLFREVGKFFILSMLGYFLIFTTLIKYINNYKNKMIIMSSILILSIFNLFPLFTKQIKQSYIPTKIDKDLIKFKEDLVNSTEYTRILWLPFWPNTAFFSENFPRVSYNDNKSKWLTLLFDENQINEETFNNFNSSNINFINSSIFFDLLYLYNINKIVVPNNYYSDNNLYSWPIIRKIGTKSYFENNLDKNENFIKNENYKSISLFNSKHKSSKFYFSYFKLYSLSNSRYFLKPTYKYNKISSTIYELDVSEHSNYLYFSEAYNPNWLIVCDGSKIIDILNPLYKKECEISSTNYLGINKFKILDTDMPNTIIIYNKSVSYFFMGILISITINLSLLILLIYKHVKN